MLGVFCGFFFFFFFFLGGGVVVCVLLFFVEVSPNISFCRILKQNSHVLISFSQTYESK